MCFISSLGFQKKESRGERTLSLGRNVERVSGLLGAGRLPGGWAGELFWNFPPRLQKRRQKVCPVPATRFSTLPSSRRCQGEGRDCHSCVHTGKNEKVGSKKVSCPEWASPSCLPLIVSFWDWFIEQDGLNPSSSCLHFPSAGSPPELCKPRQPSPSPSLPGSL